MTRSAGDIESSRLGNKRPTNDCCRVRFHPFLSSGNARLARSSPRKTYPRPTAERMNSYQSSVSSRLVHIRLIENVTLDWLQTTIYAAQYFDKKPIVRVREPLMPPRLHQIKDTNQLLLFVDFSLFFIFNAHFIR